MLKKLRIEFNSKGENGNIHSILGLCSKALRKEQRINDYNTLRDEVYASQSYQEALVKIRKVIDLVDISGRAK